MAMNMTKLYELQRDIASEASWMLEKLAEYEREPLESHPRFAEARTLVNHLDVAAKRDLPIAIATLWEVLGSLAAAVRVSETDPLPDPRVPAQRIVEIVETTGLPLAYLIQEIEAEESGSQLGMLLMGGMSGAFTAMNEIRQQLAPFLDQNQ